VITQMTKEDLIRLIQNLDCNYFEVDTNIKFRLALSPYVNDPDLEKGEYDIRIVCKE